MVKKVDTVVNSYIEIIVESFFTFHSAEDNPFINGCCNVVCFKTQFSKNESSQR